MFPRTWQDYYRNNNYSTVTLRCLTTGLECISFHNCIDCSNSGACFRESITATATGAKKKVENYGDRPPPVTKKWNHVKCIQLFQKRKNWFIYPKSALFDQVGTDLFVCSAYLRAQSIKRRMPHGQVITATRCNYVHGRLSIFSERDAYNTRLPNNKTDADTSEHLRLLEQQLTLVFHWSAFWKVKTRLPRLPNEFVFTFTFEFYQERRARTLSVVGRPNPRRKHRPDE